MTAIGAILGALGRHAPKAMAAGVFAGLIVPPLADLLRGWIPVAVWALLYLAMMRIGWADLAERMRRPLLSVALVVWMLVVTPVLLAVLLGFFDVRPGLAAAMVLAAASAPLFSTPSLGVMFGLDGALLLIVLVATTMLVPLTMPTAAAVLLGFDLGADPVVLMGRLSALVLSAALAAMISRRLFGEDRVARAAQIMDGLSVVLLILFAIGIMAGVTERMIGDPFDIAYVTALSFALYIGLMIVAAGAFALLFGVAPGLGGRRAALSAGFISGTRNLAIILAVLPPDVDPDVPLFFAVGQFPIYIMPMVLKPVFRRMLGDGKAEPGGNGE